MNKVFILEPYLNYDICCIIQNIMLRQIFKIDVLTELKYKWELQWKIQFENYEYRFLSKYLQNRFLLDKCYEHDMYLPYTRTYHIIYNDFFNIVKSQNINYKSYYYNI